MKILHIGRFNVTNIGDLAISKVIYDNLIDYGIVTKMNLTGNPNIFVDINTVNDMNARKYLFRSLIEKLNLSWILKWRSGLKKEVYLPEFKEKISQHDLIVIAGGNMLMSVNKNIKVIQLFEKYVDIAKEHNKPVFAMDIGIGPFYSEGHLLQSIDSLNKCDFISFRDEKSYKLFVENGGNKNLAEISIDPVFFLEASRKNNLVASPNKVIGFNVFNHKQISPNDSEYDKLLNDYSSVINGLIKSNYKVVLFDTTLEDRVALEDLYSRYKNDSNVSLKKVSGLQDLIDLYYGLDILVGTRMHSMIIAFALGIPILGFSWQEKIKQLFNIIEYPNLLFDIHKIDQNQKQIIESIDTVTNNYAYYLNKNSMVLDKIKKKQRVNTNILEKFKTNIEK